MQEHESRQTSAPDLRATLLEEVEHTERWLDIYGAETLVVESGSGPPLLLLHGGIECGGAYWGPVMPRLARDHRLIIPDVPGLGESKPLTRLDDASFAAWFGDVLTLCGGRPALVAHSLMGSMAARFAAAYGGIERLIIYGAPGVGAYRMPIGLRVTAILFSLRPSERNAERFERRAIAGYDQLRARRPAWLSAFSTYTRSRATVGHVKRTMRQLISIGTRQIPDDTLRAIACPVSLLWGTEDRFVPLDLAESASTRLGWPVHVIEGAGHAAHIEQPDAFVDALDRALDQPLEASARNAELHQAHATRRNA